MVTTVGVLVLNVTVRRPNLKIYSRFRLAKYFSFLFSFCYPTLFIDIFNFDVYLELNVLAPVNR